MERGSLKFHLELETGRLLQPPWGLAITAYWDPSAPGIIGELHRRFDNLRSQSRELSACLPDTFRTCWKDDPNLKHYLVASRLPLIPAPRGG